MYHYIFVNLCLNILSNGNLPSYCYYDDDSTLNPFYDNLRNEDKHKIFYYLVSKKYINPDVISKDVFMNNTRQTIESFCESY